MHMPLSRFFPRITRYTRSLPAAARYAAAGGITATALLVRMSPLRDHLPTGYPFLLFFLAVLLSSSLFKRGPGIFATLLSAGAAAWFFLPPVGHLSVANSQQATATVLFCLIGLAMAWIIGVEQELVQNLRASEHGRMLLLREFRHRSRNDLMSLVSLLHLRARSAPNEEAREGLREAAQHAMALSRVHTYLAAATPGDHADAIVNTREFLCGLVREIDQATNAGGLRSVGLFATPEPHWIDSERAVQVGLVVNECVTNALKYAFPEERAGGIEVGFRLDVADFVLTIEDNGIGMPETAPRGFGTRLLRSFAAQLRGSFTREPGELGGTLCTLRFPAAMPGRAAAPAPFRYAL